MIIFYKNFAKDQYTLIEQSICNHEFLLQKTFCTKLNWFLAQGLPSYGNSKGAKKTKFTKKIGNNLLFLI